MIDYQHFTIEELAADPYFRNWVLNPDGENAIFWNSWLAANPSKIIMVQQAKVIVLAVAEHFDSQVALNYQREIAKIVQIADNRYGNKKALRPRMPRPMVYKIAASIMVLAGVLGYLLSEQMIYGKITQGVKANHNTMISKSNRSTKEMTVLLSDGSLVVLKKGSTISYPRDFSLKDRIVHLSGEAFFDVTRNEDKPFLIYTSVTVVKVLGTSFRVRAFEKEEKNIVAVKTGKVSVFPKASFNTERSEKSAGVILSPNQQAIFTTRERRLETSKVQDPVLLNEYQENSEIIFEDTPVTEVFRMMEHTYGIHIVFEADLLNGCAISAQFKEESFKQRLSVICKAIGASFELANEQVLIKSKGCN